MQRTSSLSEFLKRANRPLVYRDSISREYAARMRREARVEREIERSSYLMPERHQAYGPDGKLDY